MIGIDDRITMGQRDQGTAQCRRSTPTAPPLPSSPVRSTYDGAHLVSTESSALWNDTRGRGPAPPHFHCGTRIVAASATGLPCPSVDLYKHLIGVHLQALERLQRRHQIGGQRPDAVDDIGRQQGQQILRIDLAARQHPCRSAGTDSPPAACRTGRGQERESPPGHVPHPPRTWQRQVPMRPVFPACCFSYSLSSLSSPEQLTPPIEIVDRRELPNVFPTASHCREIHAPVDPAQYGLLSISLHSARSDIPHWRTSRSDSAESVRSMSG